MPTLNEIDTPIAAAPSEPFAQSRRTLLVVDDEEGPRQALRILFRHDYTVLVAENGPKALQIINEQAVDAAILDIRMAGMTGIQVLQQIKKSSPAVEVIMLTAYETIETARQALRLGACDYLNKPFDLDSLRQAVANAMERRLISNEIQTHNHRLSELQQQIRDHRLREEITRTQGEIYASILHDINGPLTVIAGFLELVNQRIQSVASVEGEDLEVIRDRLVGISRQTSRCIQITRRYLSFLHQRGSDGIRVEVNQTLMDLRDLLKNHPEARNQELVIQPMDRDALVKINGTDLIQILLNLTVNGLQSSQEPHSVEVRAERLDSRLGESEVQSGSGALFLAGENFLNSIPMVAITVKDNGPGIPDDVLPRIFAPYFTTKSVGQGTGLGLPIVKRLVDEAGGAIRVRTGSGQGTIFTVFLPVRQPL